MTARVGIVTEAVNRRNGGNGSMIDLAVALRALGATVDFFVTRRSALLANLEARLEAPELFRTSLARSVRIHSVTDNGADGFEASFFRAARSRGQYDFFFSQSSSPAALGTLIRDVCGGRTFKFHTSDPKLDSESDVAVFLERVGDYDGLLFQSPAQWSVAQERLRPHSRLDLILLRATSDEDRLKRIARSRVGGRLVSLGSIQPRKNQRLGVEAYIHARGASPTAELSYRLAGPLLLGPHESYAKDFLRSVRNHAREDVRYLGNLRAYYALLASAETLFHPALQEGLSTILREAMYLGVPILAADIAGSQGTLENNFNAQLYPPDSDALSLGALIVDFMGASEKRRKLATNAREYYDEHLSQRAFSDRLRDLLALSRDHSRKSGNALP